MTVLFDVGVPHGLRRYLSGYVTETAQYRSWGQLTNGRLLEVAEQHGFDVLITTDQRMMQELDISQYRLGIVVLNDTRWAYIRLCVDSILLAIESVRPGEATIVNIESSR